MVSTVEAKTFFAIFKGKSDTYVRNELPKEAPKAGEKIKTAITNNEGTVDAELLMHHLDGDFGVGICPVNAEGKCYFGVIDIDYYKPSIRKVLEIIREYELPLIPFRSKSGGLHVYLIVSKSVSAKKMRKTLQDVCDVFGLESMYGKGKVEIFPKQDKAEGFGSSITLPYFNSENPYTYMISYDGKPVDFKSFLTFSRHMTSLEEVSDRLAELPYNDAPPCLQHALLSSAVGDEDSGRNNFLFSFSVYAKKKYGDGFEKYVHEVNDRFSSPLDEQIVDTICKSVADKEYMYKCKDSPCSSYCNKAECRNREYGLGRDKGGHFMGIEYGKLYRYNAEEPYYIWKLRMNGDEKWHDVVFKDEGQLIDQKVFAKMCVRYLNQIPMHISDNDWYSIVNVYLKDIEVVSVERSADTSAMSLLHSAFSRFVANRQARREMPFQIRLGLCVRRDVSDDEGHCIKYYFTADAFAKYLNNCKIKYDPSTLGNTLRGFGAVEDVFEYENISHDVRRVKCWSVRENEEILEVFEGNLDIENGEKNTDINILSAEGDASISKVEQREEEKSYTQEEYRNAEEMF